MLLDSDTPITRTSITDMDFETAIKFVEERQEQRMRQQRLYEEAQVAAAVIKDKTDSELFAKRIEQLGKKGATVDKGLEQMSKWLNELQVLRLTVGDLR